MKKELNKLTINQLIELVETFEHYPSVTLKDGKDYILSYLEDEACTISRKEIAEYLLNNNVKITDDNIHLYYSYMNDNQLKEYKVKLTFIFNPRSIVLKQSLFLNNSDKNWLFFEKTNFNGYILSQSFFGIKDTLAPLAEYIKEIKNSENYKENYLKPFMIDCLKNGVVITKDNIHLYYEFMDNNEKLKYINIYDAALKERSLLVQNLLNINKDTFFDNKPLVSFTTFNSTTLGMLSYLSIFGVRDTLKPIDEYISDIKNSDAFKEFEKEKQLQEAIDITNVVIIDFSEEEIAEYIDRCIIYLHNRFDPKYIVKIWETDEIYGERDDEDDYSEEYQGHSMYQGKIASSDGVFENDIKFTGTYCEISAVFSDLLTDLKMIEKSNA